MAMNNPNSIYMTAMDLQELKGYNLKYAYRLHQNIRRALSSADSQSRNAIKKHLTIREYCQYVGDDFDEVWEVLRTEAL